MQELLGISWYNLHELLHVARNVHKNAVGMKRPEKWKTKAGF
jgi:hypothetical protein